MSGEAFTLVPSSVETFEPQYNNVQTPTESMKKEYFNISSTAVQKYKLNFKVLTNTDRDTLLTHINAQLMSHYSFSWQSVPSYIGSGANITGRWVQGSLKISINSNKWSVSLNFEKDN
jgi:hypothetical protein